MMSKVPDLTSVKVQRARIGRPVVGAIICLLAGFATGLAAYKAQAFPVPQLGALYRKTLVVIGDLNPDSAIGNAPAPLPVAFARREDALAARARLLTLVDRRDESTVRYTAVADDAIGAHRYRNVRKVLAARLAMRHGVLSRSFILIPHGYNRAMVLVHAGHGADHADFRGDEMVQQLLDAGFGVALFSMPLEGTNRQQLTVATPRSGRIPVTSHQAFELLEEPEFSPLSYFVTPVLHLLDYAEQHRLADRFAMIGHSGGGWTTALVAAADPRIARSHVVAGVAPETIRAAISNGEWGDYEQHNARLLTSVNYPEMFVLAALEQGRTSTHHFIEHDSCCFRLPRSMSYEATLRDRLTTLGGGRFAVAIDEETVSHEYSSLIQQRVMEDLRAWVKP